MKILRLVLSSLILLTSSIVSADHNFSAENNLQRFNSKLATPTDALESFRCEHKADHHAKSKHYFADENLFDSRKRRLRKRYLHASNTQEKLPESKEYARLLSNENTPGIELFNIRISQTKNALTSKQYHNPELYLKRTQLPVKMNLLLDSQQDPVYSALMFTRSGGDIPFSVKKDQFSDSITNTVNSKQQPITLNEKELDNLVVNIRTKQTIENQKMLRQTFLFNAGILDKTKCMLESKLI